MQKPQQQPRHQQQQQEGDEQQNQTAAKPYVAALHCQHVAGSAATLVDAPLKAVAGLAAIWGADQPKPSV